MRSGPDQDHAGSSGRGRRFAGPLLCLCALLTGCDHTESIPPPTPTHEHAAARAVAASRTLSALTRAVRAAERGRPADLTTLAVPHAADVVGHFVHNARELGVRHLDLRFVDEEEAAVGSALRRRYGDRVWVGAVQASYRLPMDPGPTSMEVAFTFLSGAGRARILDVGGHDDRSALWMRDRVTVARAGRATVMDAGGQARRYLALARRAVSDVRRVLPRWHGQLVIEVPGSKRELDSVLQADPATYSNIAAVTTTVDGSLVPGSPVHVFVNPGIFGTLKRKGAQVVVSHEATHVATGATFAHMPTWLLEGFADYVALDHAGVPVRVAAGQILARIREHGPPRHLPGARELEPTANGLGATYEEAWLACRYLARQYGEKALVGFYRSVSGGTSLGRAFRSLGTTKARFTARWSDHLADLAEAGGVRS